MLSEANNFRSPSSKVNAYNTAEWTRSLYTVHVGISKPTEWARSLYTVHVKPTEWARSLYTVHVKPIEWARYLYHNSLLELSEVPHFNDAIISTRQQKRVPRIPRYNIDITLVSVAGEHVGLIR